MAGTPRSERTFLFFHFFAWDPQGERDHRVVKRAGRARFNFTGKPTNQELTKDLSPTGKRNKSES